MWPENIFCALARPLRHGGAAEGRKCYLSGQPCASEGAGSQQGCGCHENSKEGKQRNENITTSVAVARAGSALFVESELKTDQQAAFFWEQYKLFVKGSDPGDNMEATTGWVASGVFGSSKPQIFTEQLFLTKNVNVSGSGRRTRPKD